MISSINPYSFVARQLAAETPTVDTMELWHPDQVVAVEEKKDDKVEDKKEGGPPKKSGGKEAEELDRWERRFHPRGVILRADIDSEDWLAFGTKNGRVPVEIGVWLPVVALLLVSLPGWVRVLRHSIRSSA